jgi:hypothetical protein
MFIPGVGGLVVPLTLKYNVFPPQHGSNAIHEFDAGDVNIVSGTDIIYVIYIYLFPKLD